jgi:hypothetical protein
MTRPRPVAPPSEAWYECGLLEGGFVKRLAILTFAICGASCGTRETCRTDTECPRDLFCIAGQCVAVDAGQAGAGGSAGGGGSAGVGAGGAAGETGAGGSAGAGGAPSPCMSCDAGTACAPSGNSCLPYALAIISPPAGTLVSTGAAVNVIGTVRLDGTGVSNVNIPFTGFSGTAGSVTSTAGGTFTFTSNAPMTPGTATATVGVGWPSPESVQIGVQGCTLACAQWQYCESSTDGGTCLPSFTSIRLNTPDAGGIWPPARPFALSVSATVASGPPFSGSMPWRIGSTTGSLSTTNGQTFAASTTSPTTTGNYEVIAGWEDGGPTARVAFSVDATPPQAIWRASTVNNPTLRDAIEYWHLCTDEPTDPNVRGAELSSPGSAAVDLSARVVDAARCTPCSTGNFTFSSGCFEVDFSRPAMPSMTSVFNVTATRISDRFGNETLGLTTGINVSRIRWRANVSSGVQALVAGPDGALYVGQAGSGGISRLAARDGMVTQTVPGYEVTALATDGTLVYATGQAGGIGLFLVRTASNLSNAGASGAASQSLYFSAPALYVSPAGTTAISSANVVGSSQTSLFVYSAQGTSELLAPSNQADLYAGATVPLRPANIVTNGSTAWVLTRRSLALDGAARVRVTLNGASAPSNPVSDRWLQNNTSQILVGQALLNSNGDFAAGSARGSVLTTRQVVISSNVVSEAVGDPFGFKGWPVVASPSQAFISSATQAIQPSGHTLYLFDPSNPNGASSAVANAQASSSFFTSPTLGNNNEGYIVSAAGNLVTFAHGSVSVPAWSDQAVTSGTVVAHPAFACASTANRPGTLYIGTDTGEVTAVLVDAPKVADTPWPKYQRTLGNSGNTSTPVNWASCP